MISKSQLVVDTRKSILELVNFYLNVSRGIDDLVEEDDYDDLERMLDVRLENMISEISGTE